MENITLGDLSSWVGFLVGLVGGVTAIVSLVKKAVAKLLEPVVKQIESVDMENCKTFLVTFLAETERGQEHDQIELERFHEQFSHYTKIGGNSYIAAKVEKLQKDGKL